MSQATRPAATETLNPFAIAQQQLDEAARILKLDPAVHELLRWPMREFHVTLPVKMDDGTTRIFHGFRVQYNDARGPCKGGIRFHPDETIDTVRALGAWMTWKGSVVDIPLGGGKGGVICNPTEMSPGELERLSRAYVRALGREFGLFKDVPAPDVYTNPQIMAWMMDEYSVMHGEQSFGTITGKPLQLGGSLGRKDATALGGIFCVREAAKRLSLDLKGRKCAIQGYGNVGSPIHQMAQDMLGMKVVAVSDVGGGIYNPDGMSPAAVREHLSRTGTVAGFAGSQAVSNEDLLELDVDVLFPAALENVITARNVGRIKAKMVAEMANGPTTPEADKHFFENGVYVIPDILCNAGGVTVSYFEMVQNAYQYYWELDEVNRRLDQKMTSAFHAAHDMSVKYKVHQRLGAYLVAVHRVAEAVRLRGWA
ncbi:MAG TPA: Glu/Leu/Phe/Val dehydrogenase [Candidatus Polarisedimenticolaceae bacterium]|nr:Glu/Leu/Phe/Val dehydrogenase [Candidatus Polarisedimenticolaceae bacterium]